MEYERGMDPEMKTYFRKIVRSFVWGALWLLTIASAGIFFRLGFVRDGWEWQNIVFYILAFGSLLLLLRYYYRLWIKQIKREW